MFVTSHRPVHLSRALLFSAWFELLHFRTEPLFLVCPPATPVHLHVFWIWSLPRSWMSSLFLKPSGQSFWIQPALKFGNLLNMSTMSRTGQAFSPVSSHRSWTACISRPSDAHAKQHVRETPSFSPGVATIQAKIWTHQSSQTGGRTLIEEHARHYRFQLQLSRQASDTLLGRLDREKDRGTFTVINLAKVASVAA